ncbi:hypothetical protein [Pedobacter gandavensis]|uniref:hypothetical protein n=1 Tax=Pedobacter gandavensis TaxID=2679963 RepID=UPI00292D59BE|nr:hypothetical protein [Pedobacter gandavensis]
MGFIGILFSLFFAVMITAIFNLAFKNTGPWGSFWVFFILMFFISFGAGEWAAQRGPSAWGYHWAPGLIAAVVFALGLAAASSRPTILRKRTFKDRFSSEIHRGREEGTSVEAVVLGFFFWILIVLLFLIAIAGLASRM